MLAYNGEKISFQYDKCQQCGICREVCPTSAISFVPRKDGTQNINVDKDTCVLCRKCEKACPANSSYHTIGYFGEFPQKKYYLGYNIDKNIRRESSSGGVCKTLIVESLRRGLVDGAYSLVKTPRYPYAQGHFYTRDNNLGYIGLPNSVYHTVMACTNIREIKKCDKLLVVGTSCQIRAIETEARQKCNTLIKVCIFCKQQKTLDSTRFIAKMMGTTIPSELNFSVRYRGDGWPGKVKINDKEYIYSRVAQLPFGRRLWTVPGCNICGDPFGTTANADITLMDPWTIKRRNEYGETLVVSHTEAGRQLMSGIPELKLEKKEYDEVLPALGIDDILRKQQLVPYFKGEKCTMKIKVAGRLEKIQRFCLQTTVELLPKMPSLFYRILCKLPDLRNMLLGK